MTTGVEEIDSQHQELIRRFNELEDAVLHSRGDDVLGRILHFLEQYTQFHFSREEECMAAYRCSAAAANKSAHNELRADLARIRARIETEGIESVDVVHLEQALGNWIRNHICSIDTKLRECVPGGDGPSG